MILNNSLLSHLRNKVLQDATTSQCIAISKNENQKKTEIAFQGLRVDHSGGRVGGYVGKQVRSTMNKTKQGVVL